MCYTVRMNITILSVGKTKSQHIAALEDEYVKRISGRFSCTRQYVKNEKELVGALASVRGVIVLMDEHGSLMTSREFASYLERQALGTQHLVFVIGDAAGFSEEVRAFDADVVALSEMTFPHEIARAMLCEQIYRAQTILDGHPYHK